MYIHHVHTERTSKHPKYALNTPLHTPLHGRYRTGGAVKAPVAVGRVRVAKAVSLHGKDEGATISVAIFGSWDDRVYALDTTTGDVVWTFRCKYEIM